MPDEPLKFESIELRELPVTLGSVEYVLREPDAEAGAFYEDAMIGSIVMQNGKPVSVHNVSQRNLGLLARCLYLKGATRENNTLAGERFVNTLPRNVADTLVHKVKELGGIQDDNAASAQIEEQQLGNS